MRNFHIIITNAGSDEPKIQILGTDTPKKVNGTDPTIQQTLKLSWPVTEIHVESTVAEVHLRIAKGQVETINSSDVPVDDLLHGLNIAIPSPDLCNEIRERWQKLYGRRQSGQVRVVRLNNNNELMESCYKNACLSGSHTPQNR